MIRTTLQQTELNKRADEVFCLNKGDYVYDAYEDDNKFVIVMSEYDAVAEMDFDFNFEPDMTNRPEARDYLLGLRNNFND